MSSMEIGAINRGFTGNYQVQKPQLNEISPQTVQEKPPVKQNEAYLNSGITNISDLRNKNTDNSNPGRSIPVLQEQSNFAKNITGEQTQGTISHNEEMTGYKNKLAEQGINWSDPGNLIKDDEELALMKRLSNVSSNIEPSKRPKIDVIFKDRSEIENCAGLYTPDENKIEMFKNLNKEEETSFSLKESTLIHEYGHAVADKLNDRKDGSESDDNSRYMAMYDSKGRSIKTKAESVENFAKQYGHKPDTTAETDNFFDKNDPYVESHMYMNSDGLQEKYARADENEMFAETFTEYAMNPERFRGKMNEMNNIKENSASLPSGKSHYINRSAEVMNDSYNFMKNNVFNGKEF